MPDNYDNHGKNFVDIISRAGQLLCHSHHNCSWGDTRTSGMTIWALCECGLTRSHHRDFIFHCLTEMLSKEFIEDDKNKWLNFNAEVWDSSVALISLCQGDREKFNNKIEWIKNWIKNEERNGNIKNEPWETMWGVLALLEARDNTKGTIQLIQKCISWVLDKRNKQGILIAPHYMGFLLTILNHPMFSLHSSDREKRELDVLIGLCEKYLWDEFLKSKAKNELWGNEPWSVGHVLLGIAKSPQKKVQFFQSSEFNEFLLDWYEDEWVSNVGWVDLLDTACTLVGLINYYRNREVSLNYGQMQAGFEAIDKILSRIKFKYKDTRSRKMELYPLWTARNIPLKSNKCFVLMPFNEPWSEETYIAIKDILEKDEYQVSRADEDYSDRSLEKIWISINEARIIIADITNDNPNVLYELGIAHTVGKKVIVISQSRKDLPFNLRTVDYLAYSPSYEGYRKLGREISKKIDKFLMNL